MTHPPHTGNKHWHWRGETLPPMRAYDRAMCSSFIPCFSFIPTTACPLSGDTAVIGAIYNLNQPWHPSPPPHPLLPLLPLLPPPSPPCPPPQHSTFSPSPSLSCPHIFSLALLPLLPLLDPQTNLPPPRPRTPPSKNPRAPAKTARATRPPALRPPLPPSLRTPMTTWRRSRLILLRGRHSHARRDGPEEVEQHGVEEGREER